MVHSFEAERVPNVSDSDPVSVNVAVVDAVAVEVRFDRDRVPSAVSDCDLDLSCEREVESEKLSETVSVSVGDDVGELVTFELFDREAVKSSVRDKEGDRDGGGSLVAV